MASSEVHPHVCEAIEALEAIEKKMGTRGKAKKLKVAEFWLIMSAHTSQKYHNFTEKPKGSKK